jgi:phosphoserine phosphatase
VHAVPIQFDANGNYIDFDRACPLWKNGGKVTLLRSVASSLRPLAFVGDGATDLETQGTAADLFVGFGGVAIRPVVKQRAEAWFETPSLAPLLTFVLTDDERDQLARNPRFASLMQRASATH